MADLRLEQVTELEFCNRLLYINRALDSRKWLRFLRSLTCAPIRVPERNIAGSEIAAESLADGRPRRKACIPIKAPDTKSLLDTFRWVLHKAGDIIRLMSSLFAMGSADSVLILLAPTSVYFRIFGTSKYAPSFPFSKHSV